VKLNDKSLLVYLQIFSSTNSVTFSPIKWPKYWKMGQKCYFSKTFSKIL